MVGRRPQIGEIMEPNESLVRKAVESVSNEYELVGEVSRTPRHLVYEVVIGGRRAICKHVRADVDPQPLALEAELVNLVGEQTNLNVPSVLGRGSKFAVFSWVDATEYRSNVPKQRRTARLRTLGQALGHLHDRTADWFDGFGELTLEHEREVSVETPTQWEECWTALVTDWLTRLEGTQNEDIGKAVRETTERARQDGWFEQNESVLTHADAGPANVHFSSTDDVWLLDWEGAIAFPGEYDIARARTDFFDLPHAVESESLENHLLEGYRSVRSVSSGSELRQRLYRATLAAKFLPGGIRAAQEGLIEHDPDSFRRSIREYIEQHLRAVERSLD